MINFNIKLLMNLAPIYILTTLIWYILLSTYSMPNFIVE